MKFSEMSIPKDIVLSLERQQITTPTEVQEKALPLVLQGTDVIVRSKTGSGKTLAFLIPILMNITRSNTAPEAIVLTPTRELAVQIFKDCQKLDRNVRVAVLYGGVGINPQIDSLRQGVDIVIGTPGRILDILSREELDLSHVSFSVLDEADRMLDMGFIDDVKRIISEQPRKKQMMLFSATMPPEIVTISKTFMHEPKTLLLGQDEITVKTISQRCIGLDRSQKLATLLSLLRAEKVTKGIVFCNTKNWAESLGNLLYRRGVRAMSIHSGLSQNKRQRVIDEFKQGRFTLLVATDVAARGLHIENVSHVFNYDLPRNPKDYIHRIGRTGRAGKSGQAISFMTSVDEPLLRNIEREINMFLDVTALNGQTAPKPVSPSESNEWTGFD